MEKYVIIFLLFAALVIGCVVLFRVRSARVRPLVCQRVGDALPAPYTATSCVEPSNEVCQLIATLAATQDSREAKRLCRLFAKVVFGGLPLGERVAPEVTDPLLKPVMGFVRVTYGSCTSEGARVFVEWWPAGATPTRHQLMFTVRRAEGGKKAPSANMTVHVADAG